MLSIDSTVREVLGDRRAKEVLDKYVPGASTHSMIHMAYGMTLRTAASYIVRIRNCWRRSIRS